MYFTPSAAPFNMPLIVSSFLSTSVLKHYSGKYKVFFFGGFFIFNEKTEFNV